MACVVLILRMVALLATMMMLACSTGIDALTLPREVYRHMAGEWVLQANTPCYPSVRENTHLTIANDSTPIGWSWGLDALRRAGAGGGDVVRHVVLPLSQLTNGMAPHTKAPWNYVICDMQQNHIRTPDRHATHSKMADLMMQEYYGVLTTSASLSREAVKELCEGTSRRDVVMRVLIQPDTKSGKTKKSKATAKGVSQESEEDVDTMDGRAVMVDLLIDSRSLPGNCVSKSQDSGIAAGANDTKTGRLSRGGASTRPRSRRARGGSPLGAPGSSSHDAARMLDDVSTEQGFLTIRMMRQTSVMDANTRFKPFIMFTLMFAGIKIIPFVWNRYIYKM